MLATLSMVNAVPHLLYKRETSFGPCPVSPPITQVDVTISPDPVVAGKPDTFTVSGTLTEDITDETLLLIVFGDPSTGKQVGDTYTQPICTGTGCPIKAGTKFDVTAKDVPVPADLPKAYSIGVGVVNSATDILGCAVAIVGGSATAEAPKLPFFRA